LTYLALAPVAAAALDIAENLTVRSLVLAGPPPDAKLVGIASVLTTSKHVLISSSLVVTLGLLLWYLAMGSISRNAAAE